MIDYGRKETDKILLQMENEIRNIYKQAYQETWKKAQDYMKQFRNEDVTKRQWVQSGKWTNQQYQDWRRSKLLTGKRWYDMSNALAKDFTHSNEIALSVVNGHMPEVYAINHNWGAYEVEILHGLSSQINYTLYDRHTVERIIKTNPNLLPNAPSKKYLDIPKSMRWNKQQLNSVVMQGILQGDSIDKIADRLQSVANMNRNAAVRNARTMTTSAENGGRMASYQQAQEMGIELEKEWIATLDARTRDSHRAVDSEVVPISKTFSNGCRYPADPQGDPSEIYNCRCTMCSVIPKYKSKSNKDYQGKINGMTYDEWKHEKSEKDLQFSDKNGIINYGKPIEMFNFSNVSSSNITPEKIIEELNKSAIGKEILEVIETLPEPIQFTYGEYSTGIRGEENSGNIKIYLNNCKNLLWVGRSVIHECTHYRYKIGQSQWSECVCIAQELKHARNRAYLTNEELRTIIQAVKQTYPEFKWRNGGIENGRRRTW